MRLEWAIIIFEAELMRALLLLGASALLVGCEWTWKIVNKQPYVVNGSLTHRLHFGGDVEAKEATKASVSASSIK